MLKTQRIQRNKAIQVFLPSKPALIAIVFCERFTNRRKPPHGQVAARDQSSILKNDLAIARIANLD